MSVALVLTLVLLWLHPPFALMLGESAGHTGAALAALSSAAFPFRVVALLDPRRTGYMVGPFSVLTDSLRTESDRDWRAVVDRLADSVQLILLDARTDSPIVISEVQQIISKPERLRRTVFVVDADGNAPALSANSLCGDSPGIRVVREAEIRPIVRKWVAGIRAR